jgi:hypothetical protein
MRRTDDLQRRCMVLVSPVARRRLKIGFAVLGVVTGVLVLIGRLKELYDTTQNAIDDAGPEA